jgi:hypothetical protein
MKGNKEMMLSERNNQQITFDIKVTIATGVVYCMYLKSVLHVAEKGIRNNQRCYRKKQQSST